MTEASDRGMHALPEAAVERKGGLSIVWFIPLVAALVGAWLAYKTISEQGPIINISFPDAEGLEAGKTKVRHKDVEVGMVTEIRLSDDLSHVIVTAELTKDVEPHLGKDAEFWVVRARIAAGEVAALGTLFSGAYIAMQPGQSGEEARAFAGLARPPVIDIEAPGKHFHLTSRRLGSLRPATPVYYRQFKVGQVVSVELSKDARSVDVRIFVDAPYDQLVRQNTRFWNASGIDLKLDATGFQVQIESLISLVEGGIAFETPESLEPSALARAEHDFVLHPDRESVRDAQYTEREFFLMYFNESVQGLERGAPVQFKGIRVGEVVDVKLEFDPDELEFRIPVLATIEVGRISTIGEDPDPEDETSTEALIAKGLRAQLKRGSLITGQLLIELDMHTDAPPAQLAYVDRYPVLPTIRAPLSTITASISQILERIQNLPLDETFARLNSTLAGTDRLVNSPDVSSAVDNLNATLVALRRVMERVDSTTLPELDSTLVEAETALRNANSLLDPQSATRVELRRLITELNAASRSVRAMAEYLERHPDALIYGKRGVK